MGFSPFQLCMGHSPQLIPPLMPRMAVETPTKNHEADAMRSLINCLNIDVSKAQDNLLAAKVTQAKFANRHHANEDVFEVGDKVMLSTEHRCQEYVQAGSGQVSKFMPHFDGPFVITKCNPAKSTYILNLPNEPNHFPTFHISLLCHFIPNDNELFPS